MKRKISIAILSTVITLCTIVILYWLNFAMLTDSIIGKECNYDSTNTETSKLFELFYTTSSYTGFHPEPSYFNFIFTAIIGLGLGLYISYMLVRNNNKKQNKSERKPNRMKNSEKKYNRSFLEEAHNGCSSHKNEILSSEICGCFYCCQTFLTSEIEEWIEENINGNESAICPKCGIDSVLSSKYPVEDKDFLREMNKLWF